MELSQNGIDLIKRYEGLRLKAYKPVPTEKYWTIGYGHYSPEVKEGMTISEGQAENFLRMDCESSVRAVNSLGRNFNQNQFDALVSFTFNCGVGSLKSLCHGRTLEVIAEKILLYNKAGGKVLNGLVRRRKEERELFLTPVETDGENKPTESHSTTYNKPTLRVGSKGIYVKELQTFLKEKGMYHGKIDGDFGNLTKQAVIEWQGYCELKKDGIVGAYTWSTIS